MHRITSLRLTGALVCALVGALVAPTVAIAEAQRSIEREAPSERLLSVPMGTGTLRMPLPDGYVVLADLPPEMRSLFENAVPPNMRLLEFVLPGEVLEYELDEYGQEASFEVYVARDGESRRMSAEEWAETKRATAVQLRRIDIAEVVKQTSAANQERIDAAIRKEFGDDMKFELGQPGESVVYKEDARSVRMYLMVPAQQTVLDQVVDVDMIRVVALTHVHGQMLCVVGSLEFPKGKADAEMVVRQLDAYLDRIHALNPAE